MVAGKRLDMVKNVVWEQLPWTTPRHCKELDDEW
jgi:hypothetical protein